MSRFVRPLSALTSCLFILPAGILTVSAATLTRHPDEASFGSALGPGLVLVTEDFDAFADGQPITEEVSGVAFSTPNDAIPGFEPVQAFATPAATTPPNILYGGFVPGNPVQQVIVMDFPAPITAISFYLTAQFPTLADISLEFEFTEGPPETLLFLDQDGNNSPAEFVGVTSDTPITRVTLLSGDEAGGQFENFGGLDDLTLGIADLTPPVCRGAPAEVMGVPGIDGTATDDGPGDTGIASVALEPGSVNLVLDVDPAFTPGDPAVSFRLEQGLSGEEAEGTVLVTDGAGNTCSLCVSFKDVPEGPVEAKVLCCAEGIVLAVDNPQTTPPGTAVCSSNPFGPDEPAPPPGYEPSPEDDPFPCTVFTIESPLFGPTEMFLKKDGDFDPRLRFLFSSSPDGGTTFPPFADVTTFVEPILDIFPDPTRVGGVGEWSDVKIACAIQAELCNGLDDDGDGSTDEGLPVDELDVDQDLDGFFLCPPEGFEADCNDQIAAINPDAIETCNGLDDDCDGAIDEGDPGGGEACTVEDRLGVCREGLTVCFESFLECEQTVFPEEETCDGLDNDCDGVTDEARVFSDYEPPVNPDGSSIFEGKSTIPFKFQLTDCAGNLVVTPTPPIIEVFFYADHIVGSEVEKVTGSGKANDGNEYRFDDKAHKYIFNLSAKTLEPGKSYLVRTTIDDGSTLEVIISIQ